MMIRTAPRASPLPQLLFLWLLICGLRKLGLARQVLSPLTVVPARPECCIRRQQPLHVKQTSPASMTLCRPRITQLTVPQIMPQTASLRPRLSMRSSTLAQHPRYLNHDPVELDISPRQHQPCPLVALVLTGPTMARRLFQILLRIVQAHQKLERPHSLHYQLQHSVTRDMAATLHLSAPALGTSGPHLMATGLIRSTPAARYHCRRQQQ